MFYEQLLKACNNQGIKLTPLLKELGISTGSTGSWKKGTMPNSEIIIKLATQLNVSCDYLLKGEENKQVEKPILSKNYEFENLLSKLDQEDRAEVKGYIKCLLQSDKYSFKKRSRRKISYFDVPVSAGTGMYLDYSNMYTAYIEDDPPSGADYILRISGDSMEPQYHDGDYIFVHKSGIASYGDICIFLYDNNVYIKKYSPEGLVSLNKKYQLIPANSSIVCLGRVIRKVDSSVEINY